VIDECVDWRLARDIPIHSVKTARQMGWTTIKNGELLALSAAEFDIFVTVDRNLSFNRTKLRSSVWTRRLRSPGASRHAAW
jgi:hypothetical protein